MALFRFLDSAFGAMYRVAPPPPGPPVPIPSPSTSHENPARIQMTEKLDEATLLHKLSTYPDFMNLHEIVHKARQNLNQNAWDYIVGAVETETTLRRNRMALDSIAFRPRVLRDVSKIDTSTEILGRKLRLPIVLCPVGSLESFHPEGAEPVVKAAGEFGVCHMLSSVCDPGLEGVAKAAPDALRMFQLYVRGDAAWVDDHVARAIASKYAAFCLTVDTAHYSRRERDIAKRHVTAGRRRVQGREFQAALDWRTVERIKSRFKIPLAIKGIGTAEDARIALDHGVEFIYISNHGGGARGAGRAPRRMPGSRSIMASSSSTSPITAGGSSITAAVRWMCCRKSRRPWPAAP